MHVGNVRAQKCGTSVHGGCAWFVTIPNQVTYYFPFIFKGAGQGGSTEDDRTDLDPQEITLRLRQKGGGELFIQKSVQVALMTGNHISQQPNRIYIVDRKRMTAWIQQNKQLVKRWKNHGENGKIILK